MAQQWKFETPNGRVKVARSTGRIAFQFNPATGEDKAYFIYSATHIDPQGKRTRAVITQEALDVMRVRFPQATNEE